MGKLALIKNITSECLGTTCSFKRFFFFSSGPTPAFFLENLKTTQQSPSRAPAQPQTTYQQEDSEGAVWLGLGKALFWPWRDWLPAAAGTILCWLVQSGHTGSLLELSSRCRWVNAQQRKWSLLSWARQTCTVRQSSSVQRLTQWRTNLNQSYCFSQLTELTLVEI